jgi:septum site-determining protein MinC
VRSGQQFVAKGGDLIVTSSVSHGAELLADGSIHIYGALRGRALAGLSGDVDARIFCHSLEAELVSIAGYYRLSDAIEPVNAPCQIFLVGEQIHIERL